MTALDAFRREIDVFIDRSLGPDGQREIFLGVARPTIEAFEAEWRAAFNGADPGVEKFVDGVAGAPFEAVRIPGGVIAARARPLGLVVDRALELYDLFVKRLTGDFAGELAVFVNDAQVSPRSASAAFGGGRIFITNLSPFARKGEVRGFNDRDGSGFPNGLFEGLAILLRDEFRGAALPISGAWRNFGGRRLPALAIG